MRRTCDTTRAAAQASKAVKDRVAGAIEKSSTTAALIDVPPLPTRTPHSTHTAQHGTAELSTAQLSSHTHTY